MRYFETNFPKVLGTGVLTYTFHCLTKHLVSDCAEHGSLVGHFMFSLEGTLGHYRKHLNGTRGLSKQYIKSNLYYFLSDFYIQFHFLISQGCFTYHIVQTQVDLMENSYARDLIHKLNNRLTDFSDRLIGRSQTRTPTVSERRALELDKDDFLIEGEKLLKNRVKYESSSYRTKTCVSTVV